MPIWKKPLTLELLHSAHANTAIAHLGIEITEIGDDFLRGRVPVDERTRQPYGLLHGGVSVVLAETLGSMGAFYSCPAGQRAVGLDINANHLRSVTSGYVYGTVTPVHVGQRTHVWNIQIVDEAARPVCISRLTVMVVERK